MARSRHRPWRAPSGYSRSVVAKTTFRGDRSGVNSISSSVGIEWGGGGRRTRMVAGAAVTALLLAAPLGAGRPGHTGSGMADATEAVIVRGVPGAAGSVAGAVARLGGTVSRQLDIINGVSAS